MGSAHEYLADSWSESFEVPFVSPTRSVRSKLSLRAVQGHAEPSGPDLTQRGRSGAGEHPRNRKLPNHAHSAESQGCRVS